MVLLYFYTMQEIINKIEIQTLLEKGTAVVCEDSLVAEDNIYGVFDGATSLDKRMFSQNRTGGQMAAETAKSVFRKNHFHLFELADQANNEILNRMIRHGVDVSQKRNLWSTSAAVVRIKARNLEWVQAGDAMIILIYEDGSHKTLVDRENHDHKTLCLWQDLTRDTERNRAVPAGLSAARKKLSGQIRKVREQMNITYGVLNGEKQALNFLNQGVHSLENVRHILLFTDGLSLPSRKPEKRKDFSDLVASFLDLGLDGLKQQVRAVEATDPFCLTYPRFKCHDDIAAIHLSFR